MTKINVVKFRFLFAPLILFFILNFNLVDSVAASITDHGSTFIRFSWESDSPVVDKIQTHQPNSTVKTRVFPYVVRTADGKCDITIDTSAAPELTDWAKNKLAPVLAEWYPKIVVLLPSSEYTPPTKYSVTILPMDGVAYTSGTSVFASSKWCAGQMNGEAVGSLVHETVHVVQQYHVGKVPGWLVEGMADYVRWFKYEPQSHGADIVWMRRLGRDFSPRYNDSYRVSANFLNWVTEKYDSNIVTEVNAVLRQGNYTDDFWKQHTGNTLQELGKLWSDGISAQLHN